MRGRQPTERVACCGKVHVHAGCATRDAHSKEGRLYRYADVVLHVRCVDFCVRPGLCGGWACAAVRRPHGQVSCVGAQSRCLNSLVATDQKVGNLLNCNTMCVCETCKAVRWLLHRG